MGEGGSGGERRAGMICGVAAYGLWGLFPLYWPLLKPASPGEILASRMAWSLVAVLAFLAVRRVPAGATRWGWLRGLTRRQLGLLGGGAVLITVNWFVYIWAVNNGHTVDGSLGYFINPLVTVLFGVLLLRERLRPAQWAAVGIGAAAVLVFAVGYGKLPWIALTLAGSFGTYGLLKKLAGVPAAESMAVEASMLFLPAVGFLVWLAARGELVFGHHGAGNVSLLVLTGPVTAVPLILFAAATIRLPLSVVGLLQFLAPVLQFLCGVFVQHESVPAARLGGFLIVWAALAVLTVDAVRASGGVAAKRSRRRAGAEAERPAVEVVPEVAAGPAQA